MPMGDLCQRCNKIPCSCYSAVRQESNAQFTPVMLDNSVYDRLFLELEKRMLISHAEAHKSAAARSLEAFHISPTSLYHWAIAQDHGVMAEFYRRAASELDSAPKIRR